MNTIRHLAFVTGILLLGSTLLACSGTPRPENALSEPAPALQTIDSRMNGVQDVRIATKADYYDFEENKRVVGRDVSISALAPASLRVTLQSFSTALASLASDGTDFSMLDVQNDVYYYGPATPRNISKLVPIYLSGEDFVRVLRGAFPVDGLEAGWMDTVELAWNSDTGRYRMEIPRQDGGLQVVELTHPELGVARVKITDADGNRVYDYEAKDFKKVGGIPVPDMSRFKYKLDDQDVEVTLRVDTFEVNVEPNPRIFTIKPPAAADKVYLGGPDADASAAEPDAAAITP